MVWDGVCSPRERACFAKASLPLEQLMSVCCSEVLRLPGLGCREVQGDLLSSWLCVRGIVLPISLGADDNSR